MDLTKELETAKTIARMAAGICQTIQAELVNPAEKSGREPVTIADYASQAIIGHALAENFSDDAVLSEERSEEFMLLLNDKQRSLVQRFVTDALGGYVFEEQVCAWLDFGKQTQAERTWIIDPIDGTKGFLGLRHYCVAIGLLVDGEPVLGVLASPGFYSDSEESHDDPGALTYALSGRGAFMEPLAGGPPHPIEVSEISDPRRAILLTSYESGHTDLSFFNRVAEVLGRGSDAPARALDSQDKHAMLAAGIGDTYLRVVPEPGFREKVWDQAAGYAIVKEAGGRISDVFGQPLDWSTGRHLENNRGVLMTNGHLHDKLLEAIAKAGL
ncbi:MAG: 3'(2'),5'-bisphosphate nucleotidase [Chloroflexi bacterium]|nr:3'(2'),5'-bisphosphate nucleotidase [Chloroflexota bacterium]